MSNVNHPSHYNSGKIEVIEAIEDLEKAVWYLKKDIERLKALKESRDIVRPNDDMNPRS